MKQLIALIIAALLLISAACAEDAIKETPMLSSLSTGETASTPAENPDNVHDAEWNLPETIEMTEKASTIFNHAMEGFVGVHYEPLGFLGEKDGLYCILCRATVVYPGAKPSYALVYVNDAGIQNIWEIWMDAHSKK